MFTTDGKGFISGSNVGGHAYERTESPHDNDERLWSGAVCGHVHGPTHVFTSGQNSIRFLHPEDSYESLSCNECEAIINRNI